MKELRELYPVKSDVVVRDIKINSKEVEPGDIFVCTMGVTTDRHDFIDDAILRGAVAIVVSRDVGEKSVPVIRVHDTNRELISLARKLYDFHDDMLKLIGITGTNGKTTVALMVQALLGEECGYIGTNGLISKGFHESIRNTTPDADRLYKYFRKFVDDGDTMLSMETSSEAFYRNRLDGLQFEVGVITSITEDHLNIHKTIENYVDCKMELLRNVKDSGYAILNTDDFYYEKALKNVHGMVLTYGKSTNSMMRLVDVSEQLDGSVVKFIYQNEEYVVESPYLGEVNAYNLLASLLVCVALGYRLEDMLRRVSTLPIIRGRMDSVIKREYTVMLDYAHTVDAFRKVLPILNRMKENRLIVVTGSAGGREHEKRGPMGKYILENSDYVIFTMDDPRYENVEDIIDDLVSMSDGCNYERVYDRKDAIFKAIGMAQAGDIVLVAGKGVDDYMAVGGDYLPYSDLEVIQSYYQENE